MPTTRPLSGTSFYAFVATATSRTSRPPGAAAAGRTKVATVTFAFGFLVPPTVCERGWGGEEGRGLGV